MDFDMMTIYAECISEAMSHNVIWLKAIPSYKYRVIICQKYKEILPNVKTYLKWPRYLKLRKINEAA